MKGYTLLELVIVLAVIAAITGGIMLSARSADRIALQQASYALQADFRFAQRMALTEGRRWGIQFDILGNQYHIFTPERIFNVETERYYRTVPLSGGVELVNTNATGGSVIYLPRGTIDRAFHVRLAKGRYEQRLTGTLGAGRIEIKEMEAFLDEY